MQSIKINFMGFWAGFNAHDNIFTKLLEKHFTVEIAKEPDFLFCSLFSEVPYEYCGFKGTRIFFSGENFSADFNLFDYCIGFDHLSYGDRYLRFPLWLVDEVQALETRHKTMFTVQNMQNKTRFCNFIYGHESEKKRREKMFEALSAYKQVDSAGVYLNNMQDGFVVNGYEQKKKFQQNFKFSIAFESTAQPGFCTEKLIHAFESRTIPIYFGDEHVAETFNPKAFVNVHKCSTYAEVLEKVKEIEQNDEIYIAMQNEAVFCEKGYVTKAWAGLELFLVNICSQADEKSGRRSRAYAPIYFETDLLAYSNMYIKQKEKDAKNADNSSLAAKMKDVLKREGAGGFMRKVKEKLSQKKYK